MSDSKRKALVTGGAGFIGGHIVERLVAEGWSVRVLDDLSSGKEENLACVRDQIEFIEGDIRKGDTVAAAVDGIEVIFHQGAVPSVPVSVREPLRTNAVNIGGTVGILEAARRAGVRRVVFAASSAAYGDGEELPKVETLPPRCLSPYALQKYAGEMYCHQYTVLHGLETVALRYFNVYGPRQDPESEYAAVIPKFVSACLSGQAPTIYGDGEQTRDFVFVGDVAKANLLAADADRAPGAVINVAAGRRTSLNQLWAGIRSITGSDLEPVYEPVRSGDVRDSVADVGRARELLDFTAGVELAEGLGQTVEYFSKIFGPAKG